MAAAAADRPDAVEIRALLLAIDRDRGDSRLLSLGHWFRQDRTGREEGRGTAQEDERGRAFSQSAQPKLRHTLAISPCSRGCVLDACNTARFTCAVQADSGAANGPRPADGGAVGRPRARITARFYLGERPAGHSGRAGRARGAGRAQWPAAWAVPVMRFVPVTPFVLARRFWPKKRVPLLRTGRRLRRPIPRRGRPGPAPPPPPPRPVRLARELGRLRLHGIGALLSSPLLVFVRPVLGHVGGLLSEFGSFFRLRRCLFRIISPLAGPVGRPSELLVETASLGEGTFRVQVDIVVGVDVVGEVAGGLLGGGGGQFAGGDRGLGGCCGGFGGLDGFAEVALLVGFVLGCSWLRWPRRRHGRSPKRGCLGVPHRRIEAALSLRRCAVWRRCRARRYRPCAGGSRSCGPCRWSPVISFPASLPAPARLQVFDQTILAAPESETLVLFATRRRGPVGSWAGRRCAAAARRIPRGESTNKIWQQSGRRTWCCELGARRRGAFLSGRCVILDRMARPRKFDPDQVLDRSMREFWGRGYRDTSVDDLVEATGVQPGRCTTRFLAGSGGCSCRRLTGTHGSSCPRRWVRWRRRGRAWLSCARTLTDWSMT